MCIQVYIETLLLRDHLWNVARLSFHHTYTHTLLLIFVFRAATATAVPASVRILTRVLYGFRARTSGQQIEGFAVECVAGFMNENPDFLARAGVSQTYQGASRGLCHPSGTGNCKAPDWGTGTRWPSHITYPSACIQSWCCTCSSLSVCCSNRAVTIYVEIYCCMWTISVLSVLFTRRTNYLKKP